MSATKKTRIQNVIATATVAVATMFGCCSAQAAIYVGSWDPLFGPPFASGSEQLGWSGSVSVYVPDSCLGSTYWGTSVTSNNICKGSDSMHVISAQVSLYDGLNGASAWNETLTFAPNGPLYPFSLNSVFLDASGHLKGIATGYSEAMMPSSNFANVNTYGFALGFSEALGPSLVALTSSQMDLLEIGELIYDALPSKRAKSYARFIFQPGYGFMVGLSAESNGSDPLPPENLAAFQRSFSGDVPEPGSLALALAGLGGLIAARRRKQNTTR